MNKSDLAAAIANTSAIPMAEAANAVEFVFHIMSNQPRLSEAAMPRPANSNVPSKFEMVKQEFGKSFPKVPANDWGAPSGLDAGSGCATEN